MKAVFDTNILIDYLLGIPEAKLEIQKYSTRLISIITWMEVLVGAKNSNEEKIIKDFLYQFELIYINEEISNKALEIKREHKLKLPDAIILATSVYKNVNLITRNTKDFLYINNKIINPYNI